LISRVLPVKGRSRRSLFRKDVIQMKHNLKICVSKEPKNGGVVACRSVSLRQRLLTRLLGPLDKVMIIVPGNSVQTVAITEVMDGGVVCEAV